MDQERIVDGVAGTCFVPDACRTGIPGVVTTNDGKVKKFEITQDNWVEYTDTLGSALIPLNQKVYIETDHYITIMDYFSEIEDYNRLLFPHEKYIFSDFEGLGVDVHVTITKKRNILHYMWWDIFNIFPKKTESREVLHDFWSDDGGLEYGYDVEEELNIRETSKGIKSNKKIKPIQKTFTFPQNRIGEKYFSQNK